MSILGDAYNQLGSGSTFLEIAAQSFANFKLIVPPIDEQKLIAAYLDEKTGKIDKLIAEKTNQVEDLRSFRTSVITEAVTRGLNPNAPLRQSGIDWLGQIPIHWELVPLKYLIDSPLMYGANESPEDEIINGHPRYIRITDIAENGELKAETYRTLSPAKASQYLLKYGDILFARSGATVGKTYRFKEQYEACFAGYLIKASCGEHLMSEYLLYYTNSQSYFNWKNYIFDQSTIQNIAADKYSILPIPVPPISEQQEIADYLDEKTAKIDKLISELNNQLAELAEYKQAVISEAVTGKVDVRDYKSSL
jgi:restriction endonuclease S subunit